MKQPCRDAYMESQTMHKAQPCFLVAETQMVPYNSGEEHQQNGCWKTAAATAAASPPSLYRWPSR